jgi:hypothetical protein
VRTIERAARDLSEIAGTQRWLRDGIGQAHFDADVIGSMAGMSSPSSARTTANGQPLQLDQIAAFARELFPPPQASAILRTQAAADAAA